MEYDLHFPGVVKHPYEDSVSIGRDSNGMVVCSLLRYREMGPVDQRALTEYERRLVDDGKRSRYVFTNGMRKMVEIRLIA